MKLAWIVSDQPESQLLVLIQGLRRGGYRVECRPARLTTVRGEGLRGVDLVVAPAVLESQRLPVVLEGLSQFRGVATGPRWAVMNPPKAVEQVGRLACAGVQTFFEHPWRAEQVAVELAALEARSRDPLREISDLVTLLTGVQLDASKGTLVEKRLSKRMLDLGIRGITDYLAHFRKHREAEIPHLVSQLTTHTTQFFRDTSHFDYFVDEFLPPLLKARRPIRVWSAACSTGEEVYSLAIAIEEAARGLGLGFPDYEVLGTDIDPKALQTAQQGIYDRDSVERLSSRIRERYFDFGSGEIAHLVRIQSRLWKHCKFRIHNLLSDSTPENRFDAVFARNVFIYFKPDEVTRIACRMAESLESQGRLFIGASETLDRKATGLKTVGGAIYARAGTESNSVQARSQSLASNQRMSGESTSGLKRILVVDDSKTVRSILRSILTPEHGFTVVGECENPVAAMDFLKNHSVDLMTLDIHMPVMDGIQYLERVSGEAEHPPVVMISSVTRDEALGVFRCLELGAADYLEKPKAGSLALESDHIRQVITSVIATGRKLGHRAKRSKNPGGSSQQSRTVEGVSVSSEIHYRRTAGRQDLMVIGASTGGIDAVRSVSARLPSETPPIVVVQHIPPLFSRLFANRLSEICKVPVVEAEDGVVLEPSRAYIAPGGRHLGLDLVDRSLVIRLSDAPPIHGCRPAVDYLFHSLSGLLRKHSFLRVSAALLTGMGKDGAEGLLSLRERGALTLAQDEETCVVFGMPKAAIELGAAERVLPLESIAHHLFEGFSERPAARKGSAA